MTNAKKSNIIYAAFLSVLIPLLIMFFAFSKAASRKNFTLDYDIVFEIGSYNVKVTECTYDEKEETITFIYKYKQKEEVVEPSNSEPVVDSVISHYEKSGDELAFSTESISEDETKVICTGVPKKLWYITVNLYSKDFDYSDPDMVDEFGDPIKGKTHKGKGHRYYVQIDSKDMNMADEKTDSLADSSSSDSSENISTVTVTKTSSDTTPTSETSRTSAESISKSSSETASKTTSATQNSASISSTNNSYTSTQAQPSMTNHTVKATVKTTKTAISRATSNTTTKATTNTTTATNEATSKDTTTAMTKATTAASKATSIATTKATTKATTASTVKAEALSLKTGYAANNVTLKVGQSAKVEPVITPSSAASIGYIWSSSKTSVATVDGNGNIKAVSPGKAIIVVKTKTGSLTAACMVTVS